MMGGLGCFESVRGVLDKIYVWAASLLIGTMIDLLAFLDRTHHNLFQFISMLSIGLTLELMIKWLHPHSDGESSTTLKKFGLSLFCFSLFLRFFFRYVVYGDLQDEHTALSARYLSYWKARIFYRERLGWREDDVLENNWVCLHHTQMLIFNVAEFFWDSALVALVNTATGICFFSLSLLLFVGYVVASIALYLVLVSLFLTCSAYVIFFPLDLLGALLTHLMSSSDLFVFHLLRGFVFLLEGYLRSVYSIRYPLSRWVQFKPNYTPLCTVVIFLCSHVFTGSRAFVLVDNLSYRDQCDSSAGRAEKTHQKYLHSSSEDEGAPSLNQLDPSGEGEDEEVGPYRLLLSPLCILIMISECLICTSSEIIVAIASPSSWESDLLIVSAGLSLLADLAILIRLYVRRRSQNNRVVAEAKPQDLSLLSPPGEPDVDKLSERDMEMQRR
jgi:hypothetical protein